ncbi:MAG: Fic family protein, partial [Candidatus Lokiarchaeota archaeon]|nr:Fic family protein [Candidatus Lokiarchaeota archaeon]
LQYSYRDKGMVKNLYKEIGKELPPNLEIIKEEFIGEIVTTRWISSIEEIKTKYISKLTHMSKNLKIEHLRDFGVRFTYHSNKIEGSTLTLREVAMAVNEPDVPINKPTYDIIEAKLHMQLYENIINAQSALELRMDVVLDWHKKLFSFHSNRVNFAGLIRKDQIYISGSKYVPPPGGIGCEILIKELFKWYDKNIEKIHPVLLACLMHYHFVSIHPFEDGNGRITRLITNLILFNNHYPMFDISNKIRKSYYNALERSNIKDDKMIFVGWFFRNYIKYLESLRL